jgi:hypothetical protein
MIWLGMGVLAWFSFITIGLIEQILLLAPLVTIPLGFPLIKISTQPYSQRLYRLIQISQPGCALFVVIAFLLPPGLLAGSLTLPWLGLTIMLALSALLRFRSSSHLDIRNCLKSGMWSSLSRLLKQARKPAPRLFKQFLRDISIDIGLLYLAVGGGWLALSRLGLNPLGFGDVIVLLTAVHFHYAGFAAPLITGLTGQQLASAPNLIQKLYPIVAIGVIAGTPIVAAGITLSPFIELVGAIILATALALLAILILFVALYRIKRPLSQMLLTVSAICLIIGMLFTYIYAIGQFTGHYWVTIPAMARFHGLANALGFTLCGLLGWNTLRPQDLPESHRPKGNKMLG